MEKNSYLRYLASIGAGYVHPGGWSASLSLLQALALSPGERVLEVGCGTGATLAEFASRSEAVFTGIEAMPEMLAAARKRLKPFCSKGRVQLLEEDFCNWAPGDLQFDKIYVESVLCLQEEPQLRAMIAKAHDILVPRGTFAVAETVWKKPVTQVAVSEQNQRSLEAFGLTMSTPMAWTNCHWKAAFQEAGFELLQNPILETNQSQNNAPRPPLGYRFWQKIKAIQLISQERRYRAALKNSPSLASAETRLYVLQKHRR